MSIYPINTVTYIMIILLLLIFFFFSPIWFAAEGSQIGSCEPGALRWMGTQSGKDNKTRGPFLTLLSSGAGQHRQLFIAVRLAAEKLEPSFP